MFRNVKRFWRAQDGVSAIEFALISAIIVPTFIGIVDLSGYIIAARKVANVGSSAADLIAQDTSITDAEMNDIMNALEAIIRPFPPENAWVRISSLVADDNGDVTVAWSEGKNIEPLAEGSTPDDLPDDIVPTSQGIIMAEVNFRYDAIFGNFTIDRPLEDRFFLRPRRSTTVTRE